MTLDLTKTNFIAAGHLYVISGPSGVGKGTLVSAVIQALPGIALSVSATTRQPRPGDAEGVTYHFKSDAEFDKLITSGGLMEWAEIHGHRYGTLLAEVERALAAGKDVILEIDTQGNDQIKTCFPQAISIFIAPPSFAELQNRLETRATEDKAKIEQRLNTAKLELKAQDRYNVVIVNENLDEATDELIATISRYRSGLASCHFGLDLESKPGGGQDGLVSQA